MCSPLPQEPLSYLGKQSSLQGDFRSLHPGSCHMLHSMTCKATSFIFPPAEFLFGQRCEERRILTQVELHWCVCLSTVWSLFLQFSEKCMSYYQSSMSDENTGILNDHGWLNNSITDPNLNFFALPRKGPQKVPWKEPWAPIGRWGAGFPPANGFPANHGKW